MKMFNDILLETQKLSFLFISNEEITEEEIFTKIGFFKEYIDKEKALKIENDFLFGPGSENNLTEDFEIFIRNYDQLYRDEYGLFHWRKIGWSISKIERDKNKILETNVSYENIWISVETSFKTLDQIRQVINDNKFNYVVCEIEAIEK